LDELGLDGNAAAGTLGEVFSFEATAAEHRCGGCGRTGRLGNDSHEEAVGTVQQPCSNPSEYPETMRNVLQAKSRYLQVFCKLQKPPENHRTAFRRQRSLVR
jgi:hypothetical protein